MNAISLINHDFQQVEAYCAIHRIAKVQSGPFQTCPKCAVNHVETTNQDRQAEVDRMIRDKHFSSAMLPARHANSGFRNYMLDSNNPGQANARSQCVSYTKSIAMGVKSNLIMVGSTGVGKTHLACAVARTLLSKGLYVRYITSEELTQKIMNAWDKLTMAHEYAMKHVGNPNSRLRTISEIVDFAWRYADAMQAEADKRKELLQEEWQPDWSQAPDSTTHYAHTIDGNAYWFIGEPIILEQTGQYCGVMHYKAPLFGYKGDWRNSLRKHPEMEVERHGYVYAVKAHVVS